MVKIMDISKDNWWDIFKQNQSNDSNIKFFDAIDSFDVTTMKKEDLKIISNQIEHAELNNYQKLKFYRKIRLLENQFDRNIGNEFGNKLKEIRKSKGLTLSDLSEITNISASYISRLESGGKVSPSYSILETLSAALGINKNLLTSEKTIKPIVHNLTKLLNTNIEINNYTLTCSDKNTLIKLCALLFPNDDKKASNYMEANKILLNHFKQH